jgi:monoterpene epsilon-lactone hydrolase
MASTQSKDIEETYRWYRATVDAMIAQSRRDDVNLSMADFRRISFFTLTREPSDVTYEQVHANSVPCIWAHPKGGATDRVVLFLHGGAYVHGSALEYKWFCGHIAKAANCRVLIVDYRLAPENPFPAQLEDSLVAYSWLLTQGIPGKHIALCGDSAGGGLALSLLLASKQKGIELPIASVPMSAWVDLTGSNPTLKAQEGIDLLVTQDASISNAAIVLAGADPRNPLASPVFGDFTGITTRVYIQMGGVEGLLGENRAVAGRLRECGVTVYLEVFPDMQHIFQQGAGYIPESEAALREIGDFLRPLLNT